MLEVPWVGRIGIWRLSFLELKSFSRNFKTCQHLIFSILRHMIFYYFLGFLGILTEMMMMIVMMMMTNGLAQH